MTEQHASVSAIGSHLDEEVEIAAIARHLFEEAGCPEGRDREFRLQAEREFHEKHMTGSVAKATPSPTEKENEVREEMRLGK
jgi:hypothetical protein